MTPLVRLALTRLKSSGRRLVIPLVLLVAAFYLLQHRAGYKPPAWLLGIQQPQLPAAHLQLNATLLESAPPYVSAILGNEDAQLPRLPCKSLVSDRYNYLRQPDTHNNTTLPKYLFALDLHQAKAVLPSLMGAIVDTIKFLGYSSCALSVVEGRSTDGTLEILASLQNSLKDTGLSYTLRTSDIDPLAAQNNRIQSLAALRNLALHPFVSNPHHFAADATIIFANDVVLCPDDILELLHQRHHQAADMACAMDWVYVGADPTFYDVWIARGMTGDSFFRIPADGSWDEAWNLFWNDGTARVRLLAGLPLQVFSCWNGIAAVAAAPLLGGEVAFRAARAGECFQGEPKLFCKDMWVRGHGRIAVVPGVNVAYSVAEAEKVKALKGYVARWASTENDGQRIAWKADPPALVKCMPGYDRQTFLPWNESVGL